MRWSASIPGATAAASRQVCIDYLNGKLQFLFIAPERLRVAGFPEMLAKRKPSLIAIDEAHCISQWGHDFRPGLPAAGRLSADAAARARDRAHGDGDRDRAAGHLQPAGLDDQASFIHGFRRSNIAIEVVETSPSQRPGLARELLTDPDHRPAIIYTPSRKQAESVAALLARRVPDRGVSCGSGCGPAAPRAG